ncbi:MAG: hypothetical protein P1U56_17055 [Saprospiraceae bacterium]|nr:hypothetical protein [Saprospiraceae bacterium]
MKFKIGIYLFLICWTQSFSQELKLKISGFNQKAHVAYIGVDNFIETLSLKQHKKPIQLRTNNGKFTSNRSRLKYRPNHIGPATIEAFIIQSEDTLVVKIFDVAIEYLPFTFTIGLQNTFSKDSISMPLDEFNNQHFSMLSINTNLSARAIIKGFQLRVRRNNKEIFNEAFETYKHKTASLIKDKLQFLQEGDLLYFEQLKYSYMDDSLITYKSFRIFIQ